MEDSAAIPQHVGDHVRVLYLRLLPLHFFDLVAAISCGCSAFYADQGRYLCFAAALGRGDRRHGGRLGDRLAVEEIRQCQDRTAGGCDRCFAGLCGLHGACSFDRGSLHGGVLLDRQHVFSRMHYRPGLGGAHGYGWQIFRHSLRDDEHGR